ncbi:MULTISPECIES: WhiB family transcriptional regulator [Mycobacterium]|uniref:WhiB family transcriptional regulator n=1 Tax=Mycobacterium TaxID=1763 RepID=UPI0011A97E49|nr:MULTISPECIES: WhiB family transcriptional regulator [Mycobacterium]WSE45587.1 WhiB family transcriptional regulator [Mycobacterium sp. 3-98]
MTCSALVSAIASPALPGALCSGRHELFDAAAEKGGEERTQALKTCQRCPSLGRCKSWAAEQRFTPGTVVGGMVISPQKKPNPAVRPAVQSLTIAEKADLLVAQWRDRPKRAV